MADDVDQLLLAAMKHLDGETPSGYFDSLSERVIARLEGDSSMHTEPSTPHAAADPAAPPPPRDEDSGLHDIRNLARSTKERLSSRRITGSNAPVEDDVLASSSAGWKAVALPEPARMVALPELSDLPSAAEVKARDKADKAAARKAAKDLATVAPTAGSSVPSLATAAAVTVTPIEHARARAAKKSNTGRNAALAALGVAAAAGIIVVAMSSTKSADRATTQAADRTGAAPAGARAETAAPAAPIAPQVTSLNAAAPAGSAQQVDSVPAVTTTPPATPPETVGNAANGDTNAALAQPMTSKSSTGNAKVPPLKKQITKPVTGKQPPPPPDQKQQDTKDQKVPGVESPKSKAPQDQSLDDLLKDSNGAEVKKDTKPKLDKKQLTTGDITSGMGALTAKAQACYKGTQGTASVRVTVAPSGQVTKVSVGGAFAGKPEASCVEGLVRGLSFPPWDGGPQSFAYSYLLSE